MSARSHLRELPHDPQRSEKNARRIEEAVQKAGGFGLIPAPEGDTIEIDEICVRASPSLWMWIAVSRIVDQVLGFALGDLRYGLP